VRGGGRGLASEGAESGQGGGKETTETGGAHSEQAIGGGCDRKEASPGEGSEEGFVLRDFGRFKSVGIL
jgi:hypothetical protein